MIDKRKVVILTICLFVLFLTPTNSFALFNQNFDLPIEGQSFLGKAVNSYFNEFVGSGLYQSLLKAGFLLAVFLAIFKYGFRAGDAFKDFLTYIMTFFFIVVPLPGVGKSLPIVLVDSLDNLTNSIIVKLGHHPPVAGQGIMLSTAENFARNYSYSRNAWWSKGMQDCYNQVVADATRNGRPIPKMVDIDEGGNYNFSYYENYKTSVVPSQLQILNVKTGIKIQDSVNCASLASETVKSLKEEYKRGLDAYVSRAEKMGVPTDKLKPEIEKLKYNISSESLLLGAVQYAQQHPEAVDQNPRTVGTGDVIKGIWKSFTTAEGIQSLFYIIPRIILALTGVLSMYFFDYYVYHIGSLIKIAAAIGIALGVLFFAFLGRLDMLISSIGAWMFANATYIVASVLMVHFWDRVDKGFGSMVLFILGQPGPLTEAYTMLAFGFMLYATLASIMTWKGLSLSIKVPTVITPFVLKKF